MGHIRRINEEAYMSIAKCFGISHCTKLDVNIELNRLPRVTAEFYADSDQLGDFLGLLQDEENVSVESKRSKIKVMHVCRNCSYLKEKDGEYSCAGFHLFSIIHDIDSVPEWCILKWCELPDDRQKDD